MNTNEIKNLLNHVNDRIKELKSDLTKREVPKPLSYLGSSVKRVNIDIDTYMNETENMLDLNIRWHNKLDVELMKRGVL